MIDIQYSAVAEFRGGQSLDQVNLVNALKARAGRSSRQPSCFTRTESPRPCYPNHFSPSSVQLKSETNGVFLCKRHQQRHLEFCTVYLRTRGAGVRVSPGAPLLTNKTKAICSFLQIGEVCGFEPCYQFATRGNPGAYFCLARMETRTYRAVLCQSKSKSDRQKRSQGGKTLGSTEQTGSRD
jgi:hypothetical protein